MDVIYFHWFDKLHQKLPPQKTKSDLNIKLPRFIKEYLNPYE